VTPVADAFAAAATRAGLRLTELLRAEGDRYWSYMCKDVRCCPTEGTPFDYRSHPAAALMTAAGLPAHRDRAARATALLPVAGGPALAMERALERAAEHAGALIDQGAQAGSRNPLRFLIEEGRQAVGDAIRAYRAGRRLTEPGDFARLLVLGAPAGPGRCLGAHGSAAPGSAPGPVDRCGAPRPVSLGASTSGSARVHRLAVR
jgi:hypothetical protein